MPFPEVRTRHLLIVVAIVAALIAVDVLRQLRARYISAAKDHAESVAVFDSEAEKAVRDGPPDDVAYFRLRAGYYRALQRKYESAARRPWLPVPPDPPEPK